MKQRSFFFLLASAVVVLLLIGFIGYKWLISQSPLPLLRGGSTVEPAAAMFVSKQAPAMVSMLVSPDKLESLRQLSTRPALRRRSRRELNQLKSSLLADTGLDYRDDIQPWLGEEITLAVTSLDIDRDANNGQQPGYLIAIATRNAAKSREFLQLLFSQRAVKGTELATEQYKGVQLIADRQPSAATQNLFSGAVVGDRFVLFANHPKVLRQAINNVQAPELSLTSSSQYQQALTLLPPRRMGLTFLNLPVVAQWLGNPPATQTYDSQIIGLELNQQGLLAKTTLVASPEQEISPPAPESQPVQALNYIPANAGFAVSGTNLSRLENSNLAQLWTEIATELSGSGDDAISRLVNQPLAALQAGWGINLSQDIFSWVQGEYALGMLPRTDKPTPDWIFVAEKSAETAPAISRLDAIAQAKGFSITPLPVGEQQIFAWTQLVTAPTSSIDLDTALLTLKAKVQGVHSTVGNYEIFTTSVEAMDAALQAAQTGALINHPQFKSSISVMPQPNTGYVYLDWQASQAVLEQRLPILKLLEVGGKPFFDRLRSLTVSSYGDEPGLLKGDLLFRFD